MYKRLLTSITSFLVLITSVPLYFGCTPTAIDGGPVSSIQLTNGVYRGTATDGPVKAIVDVTINEQKIIHIKLIKHRNMLGSAAEGPIPERIIRQQSTHVDTVSGASASSRAIMNAVEDAVRKATQSTRDD